MSKRSRTLTEELIKEDFFEDYIRKILFASEEQLFEPLDFDIWLLNIKEVNDELFTLSVRYHNERECYKSDNIDNEMKMLSATSIEIRDNEESSKKRKKEEITSLSLPILKKKKQYRYVIIDEYNEIISNMEKLNVEK